MTRILKSSSLILKSVKSQHSRKVNLIEIVFVHTCIYLFSRVENFKLGFKPNTLRYSWQYWGFTDIGYSGVILTMPVDYITHPFLNYLISSSYRKDRVGLISILEFSKAWQLCKHASISQDIKLYIFLLLFYYCVKLS